MPAKQVAATQWPRGGLDVDDNLRSLHQSLKLAAAVPKSRAHISAAACGFVPTGAAWSQPVGS